MILKELIRSIEKYLHVKGANIVDLIKDSINESILDFIRLADWEKLKNVYELTTDGTGITTGYDLSTLITNNFHSEIELVDEGGNTLVKIDYKTWLRATDKTGYYTIMGTTLYVAGNGSKLYLVYLQTGQNYPLSADDHEVPATKYYWDIIKRMAVVMMLDQISDETVAKEEANLGKKLLALKKSEARTRSHGKITHFHRT